ncbi:hypothetical protein PSH28_02870 [Pseudomonas resinovorans]|nr:hypothetical protein [Pseudomonas resinovorans]MDE3735536.1 hypothetical protein [Pseudomonas resinovorans]
MTHVIVQIDAVEPPDTNLKPGGPNKDTLREQMPLFDDLPEG